jgi:phosphatidylserine decarboxylase
MYDCKLDEMRDPLESYKNLGEFFTRHLKEGVRPMGDGMVSPVDGRVLIFGEIKDAQVEQIKGTHTTAHVAHAHRTHHTHHRTHHHTV